MSSILDALKKLEAEKAEANRVEEAPFEPKIARHDLVGPSAFRDRMTFRFSPVVVISAAILIASVVIGVSVGLSLFLVRPQKGEPPGTSKQQVSGFESRVSGFGSEKWPSAEPKPEEEPPVTITRQQVAKLEPAPQPPPAPQPAERLEAAPNPAPEPVAKAEPALKPALEPVAKAEPAPKPALEPVAKAEPEPRSAPEPVAKAEPELKPAPEPVAKAEPESKPTPEPVAKAEPTPEPPSIPAAEPTPETRNPKPETRNPKKASRPIDLLLLPALRETDKARYGLSDVRVNMVRPASKARAYASAIINLQPVQVGEKIPGSEATLIGVESRAIGIEIEGTGERFHIRF